MTGSEMISHVTTARQGDGAAGGRLKRWVSAAKGALLGAAAALALAPAAQAFTPPPQAAAVGFNQLTFGSIWDFGWAPVLDRYETNQPGYQWYIQGPAGAMTVNSDGTLTVGAWQANSGISTVTRAGSSWHGTAFGGGAYLEATLSFNPATINTSTGWPSFWTYPLEHLEAMYSYNPGYDQWAGQVWGYEHFIETDIMEKMDNSWWYGGYNHEWFGIYNRTCGGYCYYTVPWYQGNQAPPTGSSTNYNIPHRYGLLWVPATATTKGYLRYYFDGTPTNTISWSQFNNQAPPPSLSTPWTFGALDREHMVLNLGTGVSTPVHVYEVVVWQASNAKDLRQ
jgi:hypothetical protein